MGTSNFLNTVFQWGKGIDFWSPVHQFCVISINSLNAMFSSRSFTLEFRHITYPLLIVAYRVRNGMLLFCIWVSKATSATRWKHPLSRRIILAFLWKFSDQLNTSGLHPGLWTTKIQGPASLYSSVRNATGRPGSDSSFSLGSLFQFVLARHIGGRTLTCTKLWVGS